MQVHVENDFIMVPMAMNAFYFSIPIGAKKIRYANVISISENFMDELIEYIEGIDSNKYIIIDMECADYAFRLFERFLSIKKMIVFTNINTVSLQDKIEDNLPDIQFSDDKKCAGWNVSLDDTMYQICREHSSTISHKIYAQIVRNLIDEPVGEHFEPQRLDSSGLYSNMYVNVKRLFLEPEKYYAIIYALAKKIANSEIEFDGFVSSSKNGALIANLLAMMLDKKSIHIPGVGPKYAMNIGNLSKEIKKRKNYIYVFDFKCTGTEMKILSALINANDAYIQGSIGIAVYKDDEIEVEKGDMMYLVNIKKEGIPYKIAGEKEDLIKLMNK